MINTRVKRYIITGSYVYTLRILYAARRVDDMSSCGLANVIIMCTHRDHPDLIVHPQDANACTFFTRLLAVWVKYSGRSSRAIYNVRLRFRVCGLRSEPRDTEQ